MEIHQEWVDAAGCTSFDAIKQHKTHAFRTFRSFLLLFHWFKVVDTCYQGHRRHLHTLFHGNPSGMGGCSWMYFF